jgi:hypothetical protein
LCTVFVVSLLKTIPNVIESIHHDKNVLIVQILYSRVSPVFRFH